MDDIIRVALADDHDLFREGIHSIIQKMTGIELVLQASGGEELLELLAENEVDVVLMDLQMKGMDGIEATKRIRQLHYDLAVIILTMHNEERMISYLMETGANGYLLKNTRKEVLENAIRQVHATGFYFSEQVSKALLSGLKSKSTNKPALDTSKSLSSREMEVLQLICQEMTTNEIAEKLFISHRTVEGHRKRLMEKFNVKNTIGLVIKAFREDLIR